jgi:hypothetical protein
MTPDEQPPEGFDLDAEQSREADAAKSGITAREADPIDEVGDPACGRGDGTGPTSALVQGVAQQGAAGVRSRRRRVNAGPVEHRGRRRSSRAR